MITCPLCGYGLENYNTIEGGWCPNCKKWFTEDSIQNNTKKPKINSEIEKGWEK